MKSFSGKQKSKKFINTKFFLQEMFKSLLYVKIKNILQEIKSYGKGKMSQVKANKFKETCNSTT